MDTAFEIAGYVFIVVLGIVPIVNPFSSAPVFISMTSHVEKSERKHTATLSCIYMAALLLVFLLLGTTIMQFFGISLQSLKIAGGLVIGFMGFRMLFPPDPHPLEQESTAKRDPRSLAFTPLALPMLCGPGSISVVLAMAAKVSDQEILFNKIAGYAIVATGIVISSFICWLVLWSSGAVVRFLGKNGIEATTKLMGFLLICIGTEFVLSGWSTG
ncbi:MAG: MarC family NAAT transporter [Gammaproteobacteria bacterium]|nr:MarC family NAAT transporter [Gammaproteobacteria bacterium]